MSERRYTPEEVVKAVLKAEGVISKASEVLGCDRVTVYRYADEFDEVKEAITEARKGLVANAQGYLVKMAENPEHKDHYKAVVKILTTYDRETDWSDRQQITGKDGSPLLLQWADDDD